MVTFDDGIDTMQVDVTFHDLTTPAAAAHLHCCSAPNANVGVAVAFTGFPNASTGTYSHLFSLLDSTIYTGAFLGAHGGQR